MFIIRNYNNFKYTNRFVDPTPDYHGGRIRNAFYACKCNPNEENCLKLLHELRNSKVYIPCEITLGENDQKLLETMKTDHPKVFELKGSQLQEEVKVVFSRVQIDEGEYLPVFTIPDEDESSTLIQATFLEAISYISMMEDDEILGIMINPFTDAITVKNELLEIIEELET